MIRQDCSVLMIPEYFKVMNYHFITYKQFTQTSLTDINGKLHEVAMEQITISEEDGEPACLSVCLSVYLSVCVSVPSYSPGSILVAQGSPDTIRSSIVVSNTL